MALSYRNLLIANVSRADVEAFIRAESRWFAGASDPSERIAAFVAAHGARDEYDGADVLAFLGY